MSPDDVFSAGSALAMSGWLALALSPVGRRWSAAARRYAGTIAPLVLALAYVVMIASHWGPGGFGTLDQVRALFAVPGLLAAGWLHYLAFDLIVGTWIAARAAERGWPHALLLPVLAATFLFGPAGWLVFQAIEASGWRRPAAA